MVLLALRRDDAPSSLNVLDTAVPVLKIVKTAADIANMPVFSKVACILLTCVETARDARANREEAVELVVRIVRLLLPTINWIHDMKYSDTPSTESFQHDLTALLPIFEQVSRAMTKITQRNPFARALLSLADKETIQRQRRLLDNTLQDFAITSLMRIQSASGIESKLKDYPTFGQTDIELLEEAPRSSGPHSWYQHRERYSRVYRARFRADGTSILVLQYKKDIATREFLAEIHRYQDALHANFVQFRGASSHASRTKFVVVEDHPFLVYNVLGPDNPHGLSVQQRVRLALQAVSDFFLAGQYLLDTVGHYGTRMHPLDFKFDATLSKAVYQMCVDETVSVMLFERETLLRLFLLFTSPYTTPLVGKGVSILGRMLDPLWHISPGPSQQLDDIAAKVTAIYEDWMATTTTVGTRWPRLKSMLSPPFAILNSILIPYQLPPNFPVLELGDVLCVDYPCSTTSTSPTGDSPTFTVIRNVATEARKSGNSGHDIQSIEYFSRSLSETYCENGSDAPVAGCLQWETWYTKTLRDDISCARKVQAFLSHNTEDTAIRTNGVLQRDQVAPVRRLFFMVSSVTRAIYSKIDFAEMGPSDGGSKAVHYWFHPGRTPMRGATRNPWGYWSTSKEWAPPDEREESLIPAVTSRDAFGTMPKELNGLRVNALVDEETENYEYDVVIVDERMVG
ncbi:hypothetical protein PLICRDRAFT_500603 [Plicaturopsis crispa FD-325 SS-3]|nr:hypothetical protein PLICRDRAFT_500603 [Plicaturopsis crispa FD-325 SS-3]